MASMRSRTLEFHRLLRGRLRALRMDQGLRQEDMEERGVNLRTYQQIEAGTRMPRLDTLYRIAEALQVDLRELLELDDVDPEALKTGRGGRRVRGRPAMDEPT